MEGLEHSFHAYYVVISTVFCGYTLDQLKKRENSDVIKDFGNQCQSSLLGINFVSQLSVARLVLDACVYVIKFSTRMDGPLWTRISGNVLQLTDSKHLLFSTSASETTSVPKYRVVFKYCMFFVDSV